MGDVETVNHTRRIARLEEELAASKAQAETAAINYEQAGRAMEERFSTLAEEHEKALAAKEELQLESRRASQEAADLQTQLHSLQSQLIRKDALIEEKSTQVELLHSEKRALDKQLEIRQEEIREAERRQKAAQDQVVALTHQTARLDAEVHEAKAGQRRAEVEKLELQQLNENLQRNNKWLEENMAHVSEALKTERQKTGSQVMELEAKLQQAELKNSTLTASETHLKSRLEQKSQALEDAEAALRTERADFAAREQHFEKELAAAQKLAALHKGNSEKRSAEAAELSGLVRDLRSHIQDITAAHKAAVDKLKDNLADAEQRYKDEHDRCQRMLEAAASGQLPSTPGSRREGAESPAGGIKTPSSVATMSKTEIYVMYAEAAASWKEERLRNRQNEILLDSLCLEMEKKAVVVKEQQAEYERVQAAYAQMSLSLENLQHDKRHAEGIRADLEAQIRRDAKQRGLLEQQIKDLGRQIAVLLAEQQRRARGEVVPVLPVANGGGSTTPLNADEAVTEHLLTFTNVQELQEQNQKQLAVIRELSQQLEDNATQLRAELQAEKDAIKRKSDADLEFFRKQRAEQEELVQQIARQRDMFRKLLQDAANDPARAAAAAADLQLIAAADARAARSPGVQVPGEPDFRRLHADLEKELERVRAESAEHAKLLREEASAAKEAAAAARSEASRAVADAAFERSRSDRQAEHLEEQQRQAQAAAAHSSKCQEMILGLQGRLSSALAELHAAQQKASVLDNKVAALEIEIKLAAATEQRLSAEVTQLSESKHAREAELKAERSALSELEKRYGEERHRLKAEVAAANEAASTAAKETAEAQKRARAATAAKELLQERADARTAKLEEEIKKAQAAESEALQKAAAAAGKADVLQKALQKAEERAATLEFQINSRSQPADSSAGAEAVGDREAPALSQLKLVQEELSAAYEKAAQATSHVSQFKALAESSDQALAAMQKEHASYKAEADKRIAAAAESSAALQRQLEAERQTLTTLQQERRNLEEALGAAKEAQANLAAKLKSEVEARDKLIQQKADHGDRLKRDIDFWRKKFNAAEERAQREVVDHAATIKQLQAMEQAKSILDTSMDGYMRAKEAAEAKLASTESAMRAKEAELTAAADSANRRREEIEAQNKVLLERLEKMSQQLPSNDESDLVGVVSFLRHQTEVLEEEKQLARHEAERLRGESSALRRTLDALRAQTSADDERARRSAADEALFEERRRHQADLDMVRESNASLRAQNSQLDGQLALTKARLSELEKARRPRELEITRLKADVDNLKEEVKLKAEEAARWEARVQQLQERYGKVDLGEYRRLEAQFKELQAASKDLVPRTEVTQAETRLKQAEARMREVEAMARGRLTPEFHRRAVDGLQSQLAASQRQVAALQKDLATLQKDLAAAQKELAEERKSTGGETQSLQQKLAELEAGKKQAEERMAKLEKQLKRHIAVYNPQRKDIEEWRAEREANTAAAVRLKGIQAALQGILPANTEGPALRSRLEADRARISELEGQLQAAASVAADVVEEDASLDEGKAANPAVNPAPAAEPEAAQQGEVESVEPQGQAEVTSPPRSQVPAAAPKEQPAAGTSAPAEAAPQAEAQAAAADAPAAADVTMEDAGIQEAEPAVEKEAPQPEQPAPKAAEEQPPPAAAPEPVPEPVSQPEAAVLQPAQSSAPQAATTPAPEPEMPAEKTPEPVPTEKPSDSKTPTGPPDAMMAFLRQQLLQRQRDSSADESSGKRTRPPTGGGVQTPPGKKPRAEAEPQPEPQPEPEVQPEAGQEEEEGEEDSRWHLGEGDMEQENDEDQDEEHEEEEEETLEGQPPSSPPATQLEANQASPEKPTGEEGGKTEGQTEEGESSRGPSTRGRIARRRQKPTPIAWPGARQGAGGQDGPAGQAPAAQPGRGERPPSSRVAALMGRGRGRARRGRRGGSSAE